MTRGTAFPPRKSRWKCHESGILTVYFFEFWTRHTLSQVKILATYHTPTIICGIWYVDSGLIGVISNRSAFWEILECIILLQANDSLRMYSVGLQWKIDRKIKPILFKIMVLTYWKLSETINYNGIRISNMMYIIHCIFAHLGLKSLFEMKPFIGQVMT